MKNNRGGRLRRGRLVASPAHRSSGDVDDFNLDAHSHHSKGRSGPRKHADCVSTLLEGSVEVVHQRTHRAGVEPAVQHPYVRLKGRIETHQPVEIEDIVDGQPVFKRLVGTTLHHEPLSIGHLQQVMGKLEPYTVALARKPLNGIGTGHHPRVRCFLRSPASIRSSRHGYSSVKPQLVIETMSRKCGPLFYTISKITPKA